jgi:hypothetical protein
MLWKYPHAQGYEFVSLLEYILYVFPMKREQAVADSANQMQLVQFCMLDVLNLRQYDPSRRIQSAFLVHQALYQLNYLNHQA